jgi:hypothetical protein
LYGQKASFIFLKKITRNNQTKEGLDENEEDEDEDNGNTGCEEFMGGSRDTELKRFGLKVNIFLNGDQN